MYKHVSYWLYRVYAYKHPYIYLYFPTYHVSSRTVWRVMTLHQVEEFVRAHLVNADVDVDVDVDFEEVAVEAE